MDIVQNINEIIENTPYTLTELERMCGFPKSSMRKWSENIPSITKVAKVSEILNVSLDYLIFGKEKSSSSDLTDKGRELLEMYGQLTEHEQGIIIGEMREMLRQHAEHKNGETA